MANRLVKYHGFYLSNELVGGYSTSETLKSGSKMTGAADFVPVARVIQLARKHRQGISLAGDIWRRIGLRGWGQRVSIMEAGKAVHKLRALRG